MIYLDHAAATPVRKEVLAAIQPYFAQEFANPSSIHAAGQKAREAMEETREKVRKILNANADDKIIFTSGGTESVNLALQGVASAHVQESTDKKTPLRNNIITSAIEHEAVVETCKYLETKGFSVVSLPVDGNGIIDLSALEKEITSKTLLISVMYVNNEAGMIQPIKEIAGIAKIHKVFFHSDACQAGSLELDVQKLGVDLLTLNGSKIGGPKGIGILYIREGVFLQSLIFGGGQEYGLRSGTENVPAIVGFAKALELVQKERANENKHLQKLGDFLIKELLKIPESKPNGHPLKRAPHLVSISFAGIEGEQLVRHLSEQGIFCSSGSACASGKMCKIGEIKISHVLQAMHVPEKFARGAVRFSFGKGNTEKEILKVIKAVRKVVEVLRKV